MTEEDAYLEFSTLIETPQLRNLYYYQSYIQFIDPSVESPETYESIVCGIDYDLLKVPKLGE